MVDRKPWEKEFSGVATYSNDANDYYYSWVEIDTEEGDTLEDLFDEFLNVNLGNDQEVVIKARKGALFIYLKEK